MENSEGGMESSKKVAEKGDRGRNFTCFIILFSPFPWSKSPLSIFSPTTH